MRGVSRGAGATRSTSISPLPPEPVSGSSGPRLRPGGVLFSLDGQLRATHEILGDTRFWRDEVGVEPPVVGGLEYEKLLALRRS